MGCSVVTAGSGTCYLVLEACSRIHNKSLEYRDVAVLGLSGLLCHHSPPGDEAKSCVFAAGPFLTTCCPRLLILTMLTGHEGCSRDREQRDGAEEGAERRPFSVSEINRSAFQAPAKVTA